MQFFKFYYSVNSDIGNENFSIYKTPFCRRLIREHVGKFKNFPTVTAKKFAILYSRTVYKILIFRQVVTKFLLLGVFKYSEVLMKSS